MAVVTGEKPPRILLVIFARAGWEAAMAAAWGPVPTQAAGK